MPAPASTKTWTCSVNNRINMAPTVTGTRNLLHLIKTEMKSVLGCTVKGSSDSSSAAMDGTDRLTSAVNWTRGVSTSNAQSWIVLDFANMGGTEVCLSFTGANDYTIRIGISTGGLYTLAGTATYTPTATDELVLAGGSAGIFHTTSGTSDQLFNFMRASDGTVFTWVTFQGGSQVACGYLGQIDAQNTAVTFANDLVAFAPGVSTGVSGVVGSTPFSTANKSQAYVNSAAINPVYGTEYVGGNFGISTHTASMDLQGGGYMMSPLTVHSTAASARGRLGVAYDMYLVPTGLADGDTLDLDYVVCGDLAFPWDGATTPTKS